VQWQREGFSERNLALFALLGAMGVAGRIERWVASQNQPNPASGGPRDDRDAAVVDTTIHLTLGLLVSCRKLRAAIEHWANTAEPAPSQPAARPAAHAGLLR